MGCTHQQIIQKHHKIVHKHNKYDLVTQIAPCDVFKQPITKQENGRGKLEYKEDTKLHANCRQDKNTCLTSPSLEHASQWWRTIVATGNAMNTAAF